MKTSHLVATVSLMTVCMGLAGCTEARSVPAGPLLASAPPVDAAGLDPALFVPGALPSTLSTTPCTLSNGQKAECFAIQLQQKPIDHRSGPYCPRTIKDGPDVSGTWIHEGKVVDADGPFIVGLAERYGDPAWKLYDANTGNVRYTKTKEACEAAARPDVDERYRNYCVECSVDDVEAAVEVLSIPAHPVLRSGAAGPHRGAVGVALNGVRFDGPAPLQAILGAHTIAAFDDCGGHVNPHAGYHYHGAKGCSRSVPTTDGHAPHIGYAIDGYPIYAMLDAEGREASDLDECRSHTDEVRGLHYHVAGTGENMILGCFRGETVETAGRGGGPPGGGGPGAAGPPGAGAPSGDAEGAVVKPCDGQTKTRCCGDSTCDGPETTANCVADCKR